MNVIMPHRLKVLSYVTYAIKPTLSQNLLDILIVEKIKSVFPKFDCCTMKFGFLTNFQSPLVTQTRF